MAFRGRAIGGREGQGSATLIVRHEADAIMPTPKRSNPGHQAFWRNFHPTTAACSRILHYALP
jgi:hypothetical protein